MANEKTIGELSGFDSAMRLRQQMQREQASTDPRRVGAPNPMPPVVTPETQAGLKPDQVLEKR